MTDQSVREGQRPTFMRFEATIAWRMILVVLAALLVIWLSLQVTVIAVAAFIGFAQAALLWPVVQWLDRYLPRVLATLVVVLVYVAALSTLGWFIIDQMLAAWPQLYDALLGSISALNNWFVDQGWTVTEEFVDNVEREVTSRLGTLASGLGGAAVTALQALGSATTILIVGIFATLFALVGGEKMTQGLVGLVPARRQRSAFTALRESARTARWWVIASAVTGAVDGILIGLGLWVLGVPLAVPIAVVTFILAFIPMIGATVAGALAVAVAVFFGGLTTAIWTLLLVLAVQQIEGNVLSPLLLSRAMQFPPLLTLLLSTGGGIALGLVGLFLAVPTAGVLTAAVKGWRRELPDDVKAAKGIGDRPQPSFAELSGRAEGPQDDGAGDHTDDRAGDAAPGEDERAGAYRADRPDDIPHHEQDEVEPEPGKETR